MFWATRDADTASREITQQLHNARQEIGTTPEFALMFPNISRGAEFFDGQDKDLQAFKDVFPNTPLLGFYGNGEISQGHTLSGLIHHYATVVALYAQR
jgi:small ligand-binding sensory domain FIST